MPSAASRNSSTAIVRSGHERRDEVDPPAVVAAADGEEAAAAGGEQGVPDTRRTQAGAHAIESVALADRTQVQFSALAGEADGACLAVELDGVEPHQPACGLNRVSVGYTPLPPQETPATAEGRGRDVEGAPRLVMKALAVRQQAHQVGGDGNGLARRALVHVGDRARLAEHAQLVLEPVDLVQRGSRRRDERGILPRHRDLEAARHGAAMHADPVAGFLVCRETAGAASRQGSEELTTSGRRCFDAHSRSATRKRRSTKGPSAVRRSRGRRSLAATCGALTRRTRRKNTPRERKDHRGAPPQEATLAARLFVR